MENIKEKMIALIVDKLGVEKEIINSESRFTEDLGADSLDMVELIMEFEKEFKISVPDDVAETIRTFAEAEAYISKQLSNSSNQ